MIHELATNSLKYGALSVPAGTLDVSGTLDDEDIKITWMERGGPAASTPKAAPGYGSRLLQRGVTGQLGGTIEYDWSPAGVTVNLSAKVAKLAV